MVSFLYIQAERRETAEGKLNLYNNKGVDWLWRLRM
jgi:hypothetical protein